MQRLILIFLLLCFGCTPRGPTPTLPKTKPNLNLPKLEPLKLDEVQFVIIHKNNANDVFSEMEKKGQRPLLIGLSAADYKNLSVNIKKIKNYLQEQQKVIILYGDYYEK